MINSKNKNRLKGLVLVFVMLLSFLFSYSNLHTQTQSSILPMKNHPYSLEKDKLLNKSKINENIYDNKFQMELRDSYRRNKQKNFDSAKNVELISHWANGPCQAVAVRGNITYFGNGGYLEIVNFSNPSNPIELGKILVSGLINGIALSNDYVYLANFYDGLQVIDVSDPTNPFEVGHFITEDAAYGIAVSEGYVFGSVKKI